MKQLALSCVGLKTTVCFTIILHQILTLVVVRSFELSFTYLLSSTLLRHKERSDLVRLVTGERAR